MLRVKITSDFFSCDVKMDNDKKVEAFLKGVEQAWRSYKKFGNQVYWRFSEYNMLRWIDNDDITFAAVKPDSIPTQSRMEKIQDDFLTVKIIAHEE